MKKITTKNGAYFFTLIKTHIPKRNLFINLTEFSIHPKMPRSELYQSQVKTSNVPKAPPSEGEDISKRYFHVVEGLENIDQNDMMAQKGLVKNALSGWKTIQDSEITVKNLSGMGNARTYLLKCQHATPPQVIVHNKNISKDDNAVIEAERRQEHIVKLLSDQGATPGRLAEG